MQSFVKAIVIACGVCLASGPFLIPVLRRLKFGQHVRMDGPRNHLKKAGTPTMGGVMFFLSLSLGTVLSVGLSDQGTAVLLATISFGMIGFFDDFIKVVMKRPLGLKAREKLLGQILLAALFAIVAVKYLHRGTDLLIPGTGFLLQLGWWYIPFAAFVTVSAVNAVNITDGLDGLAAGVTLFAALAYLLLTVAWKMPELAVFSGALLGTCLGFLFFNINPARLFMGDTGSLALGGALACLAIMTKTELLLPLLGGVYVIETFSVIIQVVYFRLTGGKRIFRMSPLHHHFELAGWGEQKVVFFFWTAAAVFASLVVAIVL